MPEIPIRIIQDPAAAKGCIALLHNPTKKTLSFRLWDLSLDYNYDRKCLRGERQRRYITEYKLDEILNDSIDILFKRNKGLSGNLSLNVGPRTPLTRYITIGGIKGCIKIDTLETSVSELPHMEIEVDEDRLIREEYLIVNERKYSMYSAVLSADYHTVKEYFLQQNIANTLDIVHRYFHYAVQTNSAPELFDIFFSSGINPNMIYHHTREPSISEFLGCGLELLRNKEFVDVLIKHNFDFNFQTSKAKKGGDELQMLVKVGYYDLPIIRALTASSIYSEFGEWHAACRYMIDVGGADIDAKVVDYTDLPYDVISHPEKHKEFCSTNGMTLLTYASCQNYFGSHKIQQLLQLGADPDIKYKGKYIWEFCKDEEIREMVFSAHQSRSKGHIPIHQHRKIFEHQGLKLFVRDGPVEYLEAALDIGANPDIFVNVRDICKDEAKCQALETASKNIKDRRLRMIKSKLDAQTLPSRRYVPDNISDIQDIEYNKLVSEFRQALASSGPPTRHNAGKRAHDSLDIRHLDVDDDREFTHRFSKDGKEIKKRANLLDTAHRTAAVGNELERRRKHAFDETTKYEYK